MTSPKSPRRRTLPLGVCVMACNKHGQVLAVQRPEDTSLFSMPGGKLEEGESFLEAAIREMQKETGILLSMDELVEVYRGECEGAQRYDVATFLAVGAQAEHLSPQEGEAAAQWVDAAVLMDPERSPFSRFNRLALTEAHCEMQVLTSWMKLSPEEAAAWKALEGELANSLALSDRKTLTGAAAPPASGTRDQLRGP